MGAEVGLSLLLLLLLLLLLTSMGIPAAQTGLYAALRALCTAAAHWQAFKLTRQCRRSLEQRSECSQWPLHPPGDRERIRQLRVV